MKDIKGYEGEYAITSCGKVWSYRSNRFLKPVLSKGYYKVNLSHNGIIKNKYIHRLVAETYIDNPNNYSQVNHKNECCTDNYVQNLEWCSVEYNTNYGTRNDRTKISNQKSQGNIIKCLETGEVYGSYMEASRLTGISANSISAACRGKQKTAGKLHWKILKEEKKANPIPVRCIETGEIFPSASAAASALNLSSSNILKVCKKERQTTGNLHWEFIEY